MKLIDQYLDDLYKNSASEENLDLKEEMRQHLIESVNELKTEGLSEKEACKEAIKRFDGGSEMQQELSSIIKAPSTSVDIHKPTLKTTTRLFGCIAIIGILISSVMWYYNESAEKSFYNLGKEFDVEIRKLAEKYDMTKIDDYKVELENLFEEERFDKVKLLRLYVADMEEGNTSLDSSKVAAKTIYSNEVDDSTSLYGYNGKDFLDKHGNIVNPDIYSEYLFYSPSSTLAPGIFYFSVLSLIGYIVLKLKILVLKI